MARWWSEETVLANAKIPFISHLYKSYYQTSDKP